MEKRELEVLWNYYYGLGKAEMVWIEDIRILDRQKTIKKIYEVVDNEYNEIWYLVKDIYGKSYILKSKCGNSYANDVMKEFANKYDFFRISTQLIKMFDDDTFPIVFKIKDTDYQKYYDEEKNLSHAFFNNYYCYVGNLYKTIREYRNKVEFETFDKEEDAIYWCSNFDITKQQILSNNIRPLNLKDKVYNYEF